MKVLFLLDPAEIPNEDPQFEGRWHRRSPSMEHHVVHAARECGHTTVVMSFDGAVHSIARQIEQARPRVVFNLVEDCFRNRRLGCQVPALLEALGLAYTGCSSAALTYSCDKALSALMVADRGGPVPPFEIVSRGAAPGRPRLRYPVIVKPRFTDGSEGISLKSIVRNSSELDRRVRLVHSRLRQDAICQEYIDGREIAVAMLGNGEPVTLPARETVFGKRKAGGPAISTERVKESKEYSEKWKVSYRRAPLSDVQQARAASLANTVYDCMEFSGYGRVDFRIDAEGGLFFLEANGNPDIRPRVFGIMARWAGIEYTDLIQRVIDLALERRRKKPAIKG